MVKVPDASVGNMTTDGTFAIAKVDIVVVVLVEVEVVEVEVILVETVVLVVCDVDVRVVKVDVVVEVGWLVGDGLGAGVVMSTADRSEVPPPHAQQAWLAVKPPRPGLFAAFGTEQRELVTKKVQSLTTDVANNVHKLPFTSRS